MASYPTQRRLVSWLSAAALAFAACPLSWAANINVGTHVLLPNTANQVVTIHVTGGEQIAGEDFYAQIGDGGTYLGGSNVKPAFTNVDILGGTIFAANNNGAYGDPNGTPPGSNAGHPLIWVDGTTTVGGGLPASGLLATLTIDTTGLNSGTFPLRLTVASELGPFATTLWSASGSTPIPLSIRDGSLIVTIPIAGDFNFDGIVDAADYTVWRNGLGATYSPGDYDVWKSHFGEASGGGSVGSLLARHAVPEPGALILALVGAIITCAIGRRR